LDSSGGPSRSKRASAKGRSLARGMTTNSEGDVVIRKWLLIAIVIYLPPGLLLAAWAQLRADPEDPPPMPVWAPGLSWGQRVMAALWMVPSVVLWPVFLPPTIYWCLIRGACG
jgi:hypothetical protein